MRRLDVKISPLLASVVFLAGGSGLVAAPASAQTTPIIVLSAEFGPAKAARPIDFTDKLAETCGASANYCQAFCSRSAVGHAPRGRPWFFAPHSICRITYRCGALQTRVTEADENDTFTLSCRNRL
jgi:hypothetical protein